MKPIKLKSIVTAKRLTLFLCMTAVLASMLAPANNTIIRCYAMSSDWCASEVGSNCDVISWNYTAEKRVTYTCTVNGPGSISPVFVLFSTPCCMDAETEPPNPIVTCSPCPNPVPGA